MTLMRGKPRILIMAIEAPRSSLNPEKHDFRTLRTKGEPK